MIPPRDLASIRQRLAGSAPAPWVVERDASGARRIRTAAAQQRQVRVQTDASLKVVIAAKDQQLALLRARVKQTRA